MAKPDSLKDQKAAGKSADRHNIAAPAADRNAWARGLTTKRVADLFKTLPGLDGHWTQLQNEVNRGNNNFVGADGKTDADGKKIIKFISDAVIKAADDADFDFPMQQLKFTKDMGWLKILREGGKLKVKSRA
jgi:hypothetical protein